MHCTHSFSFLARLPLFLLLTTVLTASTRDDSADVNENPFRGRTFQTQQDILSTLLKLRQDRDRVFGVLRPNANACSAPWHRFRGMCLLYSSRKMNWTTAEKLCVAKGGHLVWVESSVDLASTRSFVSSKGNASRFWIGLFHDKSNSKPSWTSGLGIRHGIGKLLSKITKAPFPIALGRPWIAGYSKSSFYPSVCRRNASQSIVKPSLMKNASQVIEQIDKKLDRLSKIESKLETLSGIEKSLKDFGESIFQIQRQIGLSKGEQNKPFLELPNCDKCPHPWREHDGMCLLYIIQKRTWPEALDLCTMLGGVLTWFEDEQELNSIRKLHAWTRNDRVWHWFWIGLYRFKGGSGRLTWVNDGKSSYRGSKLNNPSRNYFRANLESTELTGEPDAKKLSSVCRKY